MSLDKNINKTDDDIPEWHIPILEERLKNMKEGNSVFYDWKEVKNRIFKVEDSNGKSTQN